MKRLIVLLIITGMLIGAEGCSYPVPYIIGGMIIAPAILTPGLEEPEYKEGRVWYIVGIENDKQSD